MEPLVLDTAHSSLAQRIAAAPRAGADDAGVDAWLTEISGTPAHATLRQIFADHPSVSAFVAGLAEFSPYLWELVRRDPARFVTLLESDPTYPLPPSSPMPPPPSPGARAKTPASGPCAA